MLINAKAHRGIIVTNPNCSTIIGIVLPVADSQEESHQTVHRFDVSGGLRSRLRPRCRNWLNPRARI